MYISIAKLETEFGSIYVAGSKKGVVMVDLGSPSLVVFRERLKKHVRCIGTNEVIIKDDDGLLDDSIKQLADYLGGKRRKFSVSLVLIGTTFQKRVWMECSKIGFGETITYKELAKNIGNPGAARAVGAALAANPVPIFIPCHRVVGSRGNPGGFSAGIDRKIALLDIEKSYLPLVAK
ncbi:MAG: methylated-DNA--[protein]-cysteine S-methyltransferase [Deltaproteobacteria bacterium]|nr:methylated-DNA--[protein]-cysteine S-methyltransferase [Deltaproteobacteria bacterium]